MDATPPRIAVTGSTGLIGSALVDRLRRSGRRVQRLVRHRAGTPDEIRWDPDSGALDLEPLRGVDAVVHLAGAPIAQRWTPEHRAEIERSRVQGTAALVEALLRLPEPPRTLVSASAVGIYGAHRGDEILTERSAPGADFLARVGQGWEAATGPAVAAGVRVVNLRFGVVLSDRGGALKKMLPPFRLGLGGPLGSGRQWMSWISREDVLRLIERALTDGAMKGPYNAVAGAVRNAEFTAALGRVLGRPAVIPVPVFALKLRYGPDMLEATLLASQRAEPARLNALGHAFAHSTVEEALRAVTG